jgi:hypothetical protein
VFENLASKVRRRKVFPWCLGGEKRVFSAFLGAKSSKWEQAPPVSKKLHL